MKIISLTLVSICIILANPQASAGQRVPGVRLAGSYSSVTEAECQVRLKLCPLGKAEIVRTCWSEVGSQRDKLQTTPATWSFDGIRVTVRYGCVKDLFDYEAHHSDASFGPAFSGSVLKQVEPIHWRSRLAGCGYLWREPVPSH